jgi:hypothetical protein
VSEGEPVTFVSTCVEIMTAALPCRIISTIVERWAFYARYRFAA